MSSEKIRTVDDLCALYTLIFPQKSRVKTCIEIEGGQSASGVGYVTEKVSYRTRDCLRGFLSNLKIPLT